MNYEYNWLYLYFCILFSYSEAFIENLKCNASYRGSNLYSKNLGGSCRKMEFEASLGLVMPSCIKKKNCHGVRELSTLLVWSGCCSRSWEFNEKHSKVMTSGDSFSESEGRILTPLLMNQETIYSAPTYPSYGPVVLRLKTVFTSMRLGHK